MNKAIFMESVSAELSVSLRARGRAGESLRPPRGARERPLREPRGRDHATGGKKYYISGHDLRSDPDVFEDFELVDAANVSTYVVILFKWGLVDGRVWARMIDLSEYIPTLDDPEIDLGEESIGVMVSLAVVALEEGFQGDWRQELARRGMVRHVAGVHFLDG